MHFARKSINKTRGFTLPEVLITLGIIGVVAALTIPTLINNSTKQQTSEKLKKVYSTIIQTTNMAKLDYGEVSTWFTSDVTDGTAAGAQKFADTYLIPYLHVAKNCGLSAAGCSETIYSLSAPGTAVTSITSSYEKFFLSDGTFIAISYYDSVHNCFPVYIDINGQAGPNIYGKDCFSFFFYSNGQFLPEYMTTRDAAKTAATYGCNKPNGNGKRCSSLIMLDGWRIADDYPWE